MLLGGAVVWDKERESEKEKLNLSSSFGTDSLSFFCKTKERKKEGEKWHTGKKGDLFLFPLLRSFISFNLILSSSHVLWLHPVSYHKAHSFSFFLALRLTTPLESHQFVNITHKSPDYNIQIQFYYFTSLFPLLVHACTLSYVVQYWCFFQFHPKKLCYASGSSVSLY